MFLFLVYTRANLMIYNQVKLIKDFMEFPVGFCFLFNNL